MSGTWDNDDEGDWANDEPELPAKRSTPLGKAVGPRRSPAMGSTPSNGSEKESPSYLVAGAAMIGLVGLGYYLAKRNEK